MQKTIFVVDDNLSNLAQAEEVLEDHYLVITLTSAESMFAVIDSVVPDLILLDIVMINMSGMEALQILRSNPKYAEIPILFLTGLTDSDTETLGIELGVTDFIAKPFSEAILLNRVKNYMLLTELKRIYAEKLDSQ
ncbi:MAG: response regulator [Lachnospiraceae bacterium]|nr:response regulator [Lachnospiraceae bacterium]